jgi:hypothetical protein
VGPGEAVAGADGEDPAEELSVRARIAKKQSTFSTFIGERLPSNQHKALFRSQRYRGTGRFLSWMGGVDPTLQLPSHSFRVALRERVLCRPAWNHDDRPLVCSCGAEGQELLLNECYNHAVVCPNNHGLIVLRHDAVASALQTALKANTHGAIVTPGREYVRQIDAVPNEHNEHVRFVRTDLEYVLPDGATARIDVSVVDPTSIKAIGQWHAATQSGGAASGRARVKHNHYAGFLPQGVGQRLIPFVIESTGRLGDEAAAFLEEVFPPGNASLRARTRFLTTLSYILARYLGKLTEAAWLRRFNN